MLMDATVATGAAAMMAVRVLLDHDVKEENITLCSLIAAESGMLAVISFLYYFTILFNDGYLLSLICIILS